MSENPLEALMPTNRLVQPAWLGALQFTLSQSGAWDAFREATGNAWKPGRSPIDRMIDEATGADLDCLFAFVRWFNRWVWGEVDGRGCNGDENEAELWKPDAVESESTHI